MNRVKPKFCVSPFIAVLWSGRKPSCASYKYAFMHAWCPFAKVDARRPSIYWLSQIMFRWTGECLSSHISIFIFLQMQNLDVEIADHGGSVYFLRTSHRAAAMLQYLQFITVIVVPFLSTCPPPRSILHSHLRQVYIIVVSLCKPPDDYRYWASLCTLYICSCLLWKSTSDLLS